MKNEVKVCQFCGKEFDFDSNDFDGELEAFEERREHLRHCSVCFGWEKPSEEWQEIIERYNNRIKVCEEDIGKLARHLEAGYIPSSLKNETNHLIEMKRTEIVAHKRAIGKDEEEFEALLEANLW